MNAFAQKEGLPGMGYIFWREKTADSVAQEMGITVKEAQAKMKSGEVAGGMEAAGPLAKNIGPERTEAIRLQLGLGLGDAAFFLGGKPKAFESVAGRARNVIGEELGLTDQNRFAFAWIVDFPIYERDEETGKFDFEHNPFSMPQGGMEALNGDPLRMCLGISMTLPVTAMSWCRAPSGTTSPRSCSRRSRLRVTAKKKSKALWRHGQRVPIWRAAPRWLCRWDRPDCDVAGRCDEHARRDHVPDEPARRRRDDGRAEPAHKRADARIAPACDPANQRLMGLGDKMPKPLISPRNFHALTYIGGMNRAGHCTHDI